MYLGACGCTPTYVDVQNKFSVRYFLNLVLVDKLGDAQVVAALCIGVGVVRVELAELNGYVLIYSHFELFSVPGSRARSLCARNVLRGLCALWVTFGFGFGVL